ncbi:MAG: type VI secretion system baseplate subunit TssE [Zoogloeaceae bacterium]|nr:type VI secretion system baseplate subunit TssE [Rhodocyclaceae bacterium]MCP5237623.1 type VI secretion system baseplate subunit TssE [Zoogloeaceae bacterium]
MAETVPQDRLQPALLDRLTDNEPDKKQEPRERRVLTKNQLREAVLRDLTWLLNSVQMSSGEDLSPYPEVQRSVINFGLPSMSGETAASIEIGDIEQAIRNAILCYEPRLLPESLKIEVVEDSSVLDWHNIINIRISAQLWAQPVPLEMLLRTEFDLESGQVQVLDAN